MVVANEYHDYQHFPLPDPGTCSPLELHIRDWLMAMWSGMDLGCYGERNVIGGTLLSTHASGAAQDWRYEAPGMGRDVMLSDVMPILLNMSDELGIQAVHDYAFQPGGRVWRPPGTSGRPHGGVEMGWRGQDGAGPQMGESWALWLHIEIHPSRWTESRTVPELLDMDIPEPPPPCIPNFAAAQFCDYPTRDKNTQTLRDKNPTVGYWQGVAKFRITNFAHWFGTVALNTAADGGTARHSARWYSDRSSEMFRARDLTAGLVVDNMFGTKTARANSAVKTAFEGRRLGGRVLRFKGGGDVLGPMSFWFADQLADGQW